MEKHTSPQDRSGCRGLAEVRREGVSDAHERICLAAVEAVVHSRFQQQHTWQHSGEGWLRLCEG